MFCIEILRWCISFINLHIQISPQNLGKFSAIISLSEISTPSPSLFLLGLQWHLSFS